MKPKWPLVHACSALAFLAAFHLAQVLGELNASTEHGTYEAADLRAANSAKKEGQELQDLLHWAISHSNASRLRERAENGESPKEALARRRNVKQLIDHLKQEPTETELLKEAIAVLRNDTVVPEETTAALDALRILVEPIDLANGAPGCDLGKLGGLEQLVRLLGPEQPSAVQAGAAHALGTAAANNKALQALLLSNHRDVFQRLVPIVGSTDPAAAAKALYCAASLARNLDAAAQLLLDAGGLGTALALLSAAPGGSPRPAALRRKALSLLADLASAHAQGVLSKHLEFSGHASAVTAAVHGQLATAAADQDWDTAERALLALRELTAVPAVARHLHGQHPPSELDVLASILQGNAGLDAVYKQELLILVGSLREALERRRAAAVDRVEL